MNLMAGEKILWESEYLVLTTHRIRYQEESLGQARIQSIMLEELASCAMYRTVSNVYLVLAAMLFVLGLLASATSSDLAFMVVGLCAGAILVAAYFASRRQVLSFASAGTVITVPAQGMKAENAKQLIDTTEAAKNERYFFGAA